MPTPEPQASEVSALPDYELEVGCMDSVRKRVSLKGTHLSAASFTRSENWGKVVRMDIGERNPSRYSRIICFKRPLDTDVQMGLYDMSKAVCDGTSGSLRNLYPVSKD